MAKDLKRTHPRAPIVPPTMALLLLVTCLLLSSTVGAAPSSFALKTASFVPPACPQVTTSSPAPTLVNQARIQAVARGYAPATALWAKKKKKAPASSKKIQVKMTKFVAGTGSVGDVVLVTPAFYNNKLRPTQSAVPISDDEVQEEESQKQAQIDANNKAATKIKEQLESDGYSLVIKKKSGPDGQLFGGIGPKKVMEELRKNVSDDHLTQKLVKVTYMTQDGKKFRGDIKHVGDYSINLALTKEISATFDVSVQAES